MTRNGVGPGYSVALAALAVWACGGGDLSLPPGEDPAQVQAVQGDDQVAAPGARLPDPLIVRLVDQEGRGIPDRAVIWVVGAGGGTISPATGTTDAEGFASAEWTLGSAAGPNTVAARVPGIGEVTFTALASDGGGGGGGGSPSGETSSVSVSPATIEAGTGIATITVTVRDEQGDPVEGATVALEATGGGNAVTQPAGSTGPDGIAVGALQSAVPGEKVVSAAVNGSIVVGETATVTVTAAPAARIELVEGSGQTAAAGSPVPVRPAVRVLDAQGRPVAGVEVTFVVTGGGGSVEGATQTTNSEGIARVDGWRLGPTAGANTLEARAGSLEGSPVVFTAEATAESSAVDRLIYLVPPRDVDEGETFTVEVALVDQSGAVVPLSGIFIYVALFEEGRTSPSNEYLRGERFANTANGVAVFSISVERKGRYRLRALTDDLPELGPHGPEPYLFSQTFEVD